MERIHKFQWMQVPKEVREKLIELFGLTRTSFSEIRDDVVISDGYSDDDLSLITKDKMCEITGLPCELSFSSLWEVMVVKLTNDVYDKAVMPDTSGLTNDVFTLATPYCTTCTSTKGRHKKGCPKFK
jgi:hypothetical protein